MRRTRLVIVDDLASGPAVRRAHTLVPSFLWAIPVKGPSLTRSRANASRLALGDRLCGNGLRTFSTPSLPWRWPVGHDALLAQDVRPRRKTFTEHFEYPELPVPVAPRYRGFHRYDLTTCIACDQCAKACPVDCIYIGKERVTHGKGFKVTGFTIDYTKCMFCALCVDPCPVDCIFMGATHDLSCYSRDGCIVDFARLPVEIGWGRATLNPTAVAGSKVIAEPVHGGPNQ